MEARPWELPPFSDPWLRLENTHHKNAHMSVTSAATRPVFRLKLAVAWGTFYFVRLCERLLPKSVLSLLLWPPAAAYDLMQVRQRKPVTCWRRFPESHFAPEGRLQLAQLNLMH